MKHFRGVFPTLIQKMAKDQFTKHSINKDFVRLYKSLNQTKETDPRKIKEKSQYNTLKHLLLPR